MLPLSHKNTIMYRYIIIAALILAGISAQAQIKDRTLEQSQEEKTVMEVEDSLPRPIPFLLPQTLFIPKDRLFGYGPWIYAPITRPVVYILPTYGFSGSVGFGLYSIQHPDRFFSTLEGFNGFNIPQLYISQQMMLGNTLRLARNFYMMSGILYGAQLGIRGNNWGMGERSGFVYNPKENVSIVIWDQYFNALTVYFPVLFPGATSGAAIRLPATPEIFSFGLQANFTVGQFIIGVGTSIAPGKEH